MNGTRIVRVAEGKNSTLSHLYLGGLFTCYLLEDKIRETKIPGETCIPEGKYGLRLNKLAKMNATFQKRYPDIHQGMVEITEIPSFQGVFFHPGNNIRDTAGCPLTGSYWTLVNGDYVLMQSGYAYQYAYLRLLDSIKQGFRLLEVTNRIRG